MDPALEETQVVDGDERGAEHFFDVEEVAEIAFREVSAAVAIAAVFQRGFVVRVLGVAEAQGAGVGEGQGVAAVSRGEDAIEHVDAAFDGFEDVFGVADAHEVAGFEVGDEGSDSFDGVDHALVAFADGEPAEGVAGEVEGGEGLGGKGAGFEVGAPLHDAEEGGGGGGHFRFSIFDFRLGIEQGGVLDELFVGLFAEGGPLVGAGEGLGEAFGGAIGGGAVVEGHDDVGAQEMLDAHGFVGGEADDVAVDVGFEGDASPGRVIKLAKF